MIGVDPEGSSLAMPESLNKEREGEMYHVEGNLQAWHKPTLRRWSDKHTHSSVHCATVTRVARDID